MKKLKFIILFLFTLIFINGIYLNLYALSYPGEVDVHLIKFNYDQNSTNYDALNIKKNDTYPTNYIYFDEWKVDNGNVVTKKFAYIKNQSNRRVQAVFYHNQNKYQHFQMIIITNPYSGIGFGNYGNNMVEFPPDGTGYSELTTFEFNSGSVPNSVDKRNVTYKWWVELIVGMYPSSFNIGYTNHDYYTLLAAPQAPMTVPWTDVLDSACVWAKYQSTTADVAKKVTEGIYNMGDTDGDIDYDYYTYYCEGYYKLKLSYFLYHVKFTSNVQVNCTDCANLVNVFTAAVGCQSHNKRIWDGINTNEIDPIGSSYNWTTVSWSYHQYGWLNNKVNDASLRLDRYVTPRVPTDMDQGDYNDLLINGTLPSNSAIYTTEIVN